MTGSVARANHLSVLRGCLGLRLDRAFKKINFFLALNYFLYFESF